MWLASFAVTNIVTLYVCSVSDIQLVFALLFEYQWLCEFSYVVECYAISFVYFVSHWNEPLCVYVVSEYMYIQLSLYIW